MQAGFGRNIVKAGMACRFGLESDVTEKRARFVTMIEWVTGKEFTAGPRTVAFLLELVLFIALVLGLMLVLPLLIADIGERPWLRNGIHFGLIFLWSMLYGRAQKRTRPS